MHGLCDGLQSGVMYRVNTETSSGAVCAKRACIDGMNSLEYCLNVQYTVNIMITEELYFWQIQWAGTWMTTRKRLTRQAVQVDHPEAVLVEGSRQLLLTPETPEECRMANSRSRSSSPDVIYRV
jgi:hypothetical protein